MQETWVQSLGQKDPLEKEMATHSSILAWNIPWRGTWQGTIHGGHKRVGHNLMTKQQQWMNSPRVILQSESGRQPEPSQGALQYLQVREEDPTKETTGVSSKVGRKLGKFDDVEADGLIS